MLQEVECTGKVLPNGLVRIPVCALHQLRLRPDMPVKVILRATELTPEEKERLASERAAVWRQVDTLRAELSTQDFDLTESLLQVREEEDASL